MTDAPLSLMIPGVEKRRADFMRRLAADAPAYILVGARDENRFEPTDSVASMIAFQPFYRFVRERYREVARIGRFAVLRRFR
jgi:hypothetical protein